MGVKTIILLSLLCFVVLSQVQGAEGWSGSIVRYWRWRYTTCWRCICRYWWGCSYWRAFTCTRWYLDYTCARGWTHNGNRACIIPICRPNCANGGTCIRPNECDCPEGTSGQFCQTLECSTDRPCYPGNCYDDNKCNCTEGFGKNGPYSSQTGETYGCLLMEESEKPTIGRSTAIIEYTRLVDNYLIYYFLLDGTNETSGFPVWSNQNRFNRLSFEFESDYEQPEDLPDRPLYVHDMKLGIVKADVDVVIRYFNNTLKHSYSYTCDGVNDLNPSEDVFNCTLRNLPFSTLIEHADFMNVTYTAYSGGYRRMRTSTAFLPFENFTKVSEMKTTVFRFDFIAPKYCKEERSFGPCTNTTTPLEVLDEFTKNPIQLRWEGWADDEYGSGIWIYYFEVHKLVNKNPATQTLTEENPIQPTQSFNVSADTSRVEISVADPGMYSILMEVVDISNNSKWTRQFVLYDDFSSISLNTEDGKMFFVSSAISETNYTWQTAADGEETEFVVEWAGHFQNQFHDDNFLLNEIEVFPLQFSQVQDDGILATEKFVIDLLDDNRGNRTRSAIDNRHGIVKYEYAVVTTTDSSEPAVGWQEISGLDETVTFKEMLVNGAAVRIWVRAHDIMGNMKADSTVVRIDSTPPKLQDVEDTQFIININNGTYLHTTRINCDAQDEQSGVYKLGIDINIKVPSTIDTNFSTRVPANIDREKDPLTDIECTQSADPNICFIKEQQIDLDNCWFMIEDRTKLSEANATITITAYNQATLSRNISYTLANLTRLSGLSEYSGPTGFRVENVDDTSFRIVWDLPDKESCYGKADIIIIITELKGDNTVQLHPRIVSSSAKYFDVGGLTPDSTYSLDVASQLPGGGTSPLINFQAQTASESETTGVPVGVVVGAVAAVLAILVLVVVIMVFLVRRGYIHPVDTARDIKRRATTRIRKTIYGEDVLRARSNKSYASYDNRQSELYIYGGDDFDGPQAYHIDRDDITFDTLIISGRFANIYKATLRKSKQSTEVVVAKTLKENFSSEDETLMKAKINFTGTVAGEHPNVLKFIGAVVDDPAMGPFILYEYCEHGPMKDYLKSQKNNLTIEMQETLFRFGLAVARGMEYLADKNIVHRRLAARNILLTFLNEVKISGFGPQPLNGADDEDVEQGKKERIPIKWMPPECMKSTAEATEKSDVWSYAVVLWEIFSLGDDPYSRIRGRDLPSKIKKGERLAKPEQCDDTWYDVMKRCWNYSPDKRPGFMEIRNELDSMFEQAGGEEDYYYYKR